jgi:crotonobetainyl-CoA:carnitine CoA-transferase CaiB-like acyl-CoA transferase
LTNKSEPCEIDFLDTVPEFAGMMLKGMRIVSFCHYLQGPASTQYLADLGADVIKVEAIRGAYERHWSGAGVFVEGVSGFFLCANRNKRSIGIDLKSTQGLEVALKLVDTADVLVQNFRPGVLERLGLGYEALRQRRPGIIYASASGFGPSGPMKDKPGQDLLVQARTGLVAASGSGSTPTGAAICDQHGGALLAMGILAAYVQRLRTGKGSLVEVSLFNAAIDLQVEALTNYLSGEVDRSRYVRDSHLATWFHQAPYGVYETADARGVAISLNDPRSFADALEDEGLRAFVGSDPYGERDRYARLTAVAVKHFGFDELARRLDGKNLWWAPVQDYTDLVNDPQAQHCRIFQEVDVKGHKATLVNHPIRYDGEVPAVRHLALDVGQDTREILQELGYEPTAIETLAQSGVISGPDLTVRRTANSPDVRQD